LTTERLGHIERGHPELIGRTDEILAALQDPDGYRVSNTDPLVLALEAISHPVTSQVVRAVVRYEDEGCVAGTSIGFVLTAYTTTSRQTPEWGKFESLRK